jgi:hypothetical protein
MRLSDGARASFIKRLEELQGNTDYEATHSRADDILCVVLGILGYEDIVAAWDKVGKWYA